MRGNTIVCIFFKSFWPLTAVSTGRPVKMTLKTFRRDMTDGSLDEGGGSEDDERAGVF